MSVPARPALRSSAWWRARLANSRDRLVLAIGASVLLHLALLCVRFVAPDRPARVAEPSLEVVLLDAPGDAQALTPEAIAQFDATGGGDARSAQADVVDVAHDSYPDSHGNSHRDGLSGTPGDNPVDMQARIDRQMAEYRSRPKRVTFGIDAVGASYARYVAEWAARIEHLGTQRFPAEARGRLYDSLIITVELDRNGRVVNVIIEQPSRHEALNRAVRQIIQAGEPYAPFDAQIAREADILQITRTWTFTREALATASLPPQAAP